MNSEHFLKVEDDLMKEAVAGGMIGCYLDDGFPFYYINDTMLSYLGYPSKDEFIGQINGLIINCIHPDDQKIIYEEILKLTEHADEYSVEYRMRKKDNSYIWIHEIGKKLIAEEEQRTVLLSVCYDVTLQKEEQSRLKESEKKLNETLANMPGGLMIVDVKGKDQAVPTFISEGFCEMLHITKDEAESIYGTNAFAGIHPEDRVQLEHMKAEAHATNENQGEAVYRLGDGKGNYTWVKNTSRVVIKNGLPMLYILYTDISKEVHLQKELSSTTKDIKEIVDNIPGGAVKIKLCEDKVIPVYLSDSWCAMMHDTRKNLMQVYGRNALDGVHPDDYERVKKDLFAAIRTNRIYDADFRICNSKGEYRYVNHRSSQVSDSNGAINYYAVFTDKTDRIIAEEEVKRANRDMELLYNSIPGAVFKCRYHSDMDVIFANDGLFRFIGYSRKEFKDRFDNKMFRIVFIDDQKVMEQRIEHQLLYGTTIRDDIRLVCKNGIIKWISLHAELLKDENGEKYYYCTFVDITEKKCAEINLANTQQKLNAAILHAGINYWEYDMRNHYAYLNDPITKEYGIGFLMENYPESAYTSSTLAPESVNELKRIIGAVEKGESYSVGDIKTIDAKGNEIWKRMRFSTIYDEDHKPFWAFATAENINDYKDLEQQFAIAAEQAGVEAWIYDFAHKTITRKANALTKNFAPKVVYNVPESLVEDKIVHPDDAETFFAMYQKIASGEKHASIIVHMLQGDHQTYATHRMNYTVLFDKSGKPERAIETSIDISRQVLLQKRYQEAVEMHHNIQNADVLISGYCNLTKNRMIEINAADGIDYVKKYANDRDALFKDISKGIADEEKKKEFLDHFLTAPLRNAFTKGNPGYSIACKLAISHGLFKYVRITVDILQDPKTNDLTGFFMMVDETENVLFNEVADYVTKMHCDWVVDIDVNKDYYTMPITRPGLDHMPPLEGTFSRNNEEYARTFADTESTETCIEKLSYPYMLEHLSKEESYTFYYRIKEDDEILTKKIVVFYIDKDLGHAGFIRIDVTDTLREEHKKNEALYHALTASEQANKAKTEFLSRMSHDIRTPMNAIVGMTALSKQEIDDKEKILENLDIIDTSSKLLLRIINDVLDMSQIESGRMTMVQEAFDCSAECKTVSEMAMVMMEEKKQHFVIQRSIHHQFFVGDVIRLKRCVMNLLTNASKFTPEGGTITLLASEEATNNANISELVFTVINTGEGIPQEKLETIFRPFEQLNTDSKDLGTGLGLAIVKSLVESKGGTVSVISELGKGSRFTMRIPMRLSNEGPKESDIIESKDNSFSADLTHLHILLCEDHPINMKVAVRMLEKCGAAVDTAENGAIGYDKFTQSKESTYDLILMDVQMPIMNGYECTRAIRSSSHVQAKSIPIIAMTANAFTEDIQKSFASGMNGHIAKPISIDMIVKAIKEVLPDL